MYLVILQARTSSRRLPCKSLLSVENDILLTYVIKRILFNLFTNRFIVATSDHYTDNYICKLVDKINVKLFRGSLENVLSRFVQIANVNNLDDNDTIIRLTGDNPIVDGFFLNKMRKIFEENKFDYFSAEPNNILHKNWPKGLSAEFIKVKLLRDSLKNDKSKDNLEHVTAYIKNNCINNKTMYDFYKFNEDFTGVTTGIDTFDDYIKFVNLITNYKVNNKTPFDKFLRFYKKND